VPPVVSQKTVSWPAAGEVKTVQLGETMVKTYNVDTISKVVLSAPLRHLAAYRRDTMAIDLPSGEYILSGKDQTGGRFYSKAKRDSTVSWPDGPGKFTDPEPISAGIHIDTQGTASVFWSWKSGVVLVEPDSSIPNIASSEDRAPEASRFQRELIYTGAAGGVLTVTYREFSNDMARPAFTQELKYDLSDKVVGYKTARFEVLKTSNSAITYRVLSPLETGTP